MEIPQEYLDAFIRACPHWDAKGRTCLVACELVPFMGPQQMNGSGTYVGEGIICSIPPFQTFGSHAAWFWWCLVLHPKLLSKHSIYFSIAHLGEAKKPEQGFYRAGQSDEKVKRDNVISAQFKISQSPPLLRKSQRAWAGHHRGMAVSVPPAHLWVLVAKFMACLWTPKWQEQKASIYSACM